MRAIKIIALVALIIVLEWLLYRSPLFDFADASHITAAILAVAAILAIAAEQLNKTGSEIQTQTEESLRDQADMQRQRSALLQLATSKTLQNGDLRTAIEELTQISAGTLNVERVGVWLFDSERTKISCFCLFQRSRGLHSAGDELDVKSAPRYFDALSRERVIVADDVRSNPLTNEFTYLGEFGVTSMIDAPIYVHGRLLGIVCHEHVGPPRRWKVDEQLFACCISDMIGRAFERLERLKISAELGRKSQAIEAAMEGIAIIEADQTLSYVNPTLLRLFGYKSGSDVLGGDWRRFFNANSLENLEANLKENIRKHGKYLCEIEGLKSNGTTFPLELAVSLLGDGGWVCLIRDISRRKEAEKNLIESRRFLRQVIDLNPNFIFVKDRDGVFMLANDAVAEVYGTTVDGLVGRSDADFNPNQEEVDHFRNDDLKVIDGGDLLKVPEERITDSRGRERWLHTIKRPLTLPGSSKVCVLGVATDITEQKKLRDQLLHSQKMDAIGQLAGGIAHDFNNLMTGILGYTTLIKMEAEPSGQIAQNADIIERTATRAAELTQKLLGFARQGKHQNVPIDLHALINDTVAILNRTIEQNISVVLRLNATNPFVRGDPLQMQQIVLNLAINARDAMSLATGGTDGGQLIIETRQSSRGESRNCGDLIVGTDHNGILRAGIELLVIDTGCGIDEATKERLFEPFFTTKAEGRGTGLGLAMVYGIVTNHGGTISVQSEPGLGATFCVGLPSVDVPSEKALDNPQQNAPKKGSGRILVVDDHEIVREVTAGMLESLGYEVLLAENGNDALKIYAARSKQIDLVLLDLVMPTMGARECFRELQALNPAVRVLLMTGYARNPQMIDQVLNDGVVGLIHKPYDLRILALAVEQAMTGDAASGTGIPIDIRSAGNE